LHLIVDPVTTIYSQISSGSYSIRRGSTFNANTESLLDAIQHEVSCPEANVTVNPLSEWH